MSELIPFTFDTHEVRVHLDDAGEPWWVAKDVCDVLGLAKIDRALARLRPEEKDAQRMSTPGGMQALSIVSESGLYRLIFRSDKPEAQRFQDWVFHTVLPQIRKTGSYGHPTTPAVVNPEHQLMIDMVIRIDQNEQRALAAEQRSIRAEAKADMLIDAKDFLTVAEYVYINRLTHKLPKSAYKAASDHLQVYCLEQDIPFRPQPVGGKRWDTEFSYLPDVYEKAFTPWLYRRNSQTTLRIIKEGE